MNWNDLKYFVLLVNEQTLSATAEKLEVQHTTVARRIGCLEKSIGLRLFYRMGKRYTLTQEGKNLYAQAADIEREIHTFNRMAVNQTIMQGTVKLSAPPLLANEWLLPHITCFQKQYPDICIDIQGESKLSNLCQREADIALRLGRPTESELVIRKLTEIHYQFHAHIDYWQRAERKLVAFDGSPALLKWFHQVIQHTQYDVAFKTNDLFIAQNAIKQQLGIGILPKELVAKDTSLVPVNLLSDNLQNKQKTSLYLVMHEDVRRSPAVRAVADFLISQFKHLYSL